MALASPAPSESVKASQTQSHQVGGLNFELGTWNLELIIATMPEELQLPVKERDVAPLFTAQIGGGLTVALADLRGKNVVLYFYPRDNTPGCTIEACQFRDQFEDFKKHGIVVLGVSADSAASHEKFAQRFRLPFVLLADEDKAIARAYGAWGEKSFLGRKFMGMRRITFLIGPDGRIRKIWRKVKPSPHAAEVLAAALA
jgi:thioredoxin-dependent peroxiredoxin